MLGNDVIDLDLVKTESDPLRKGWLEKIFTAGERRWIFDSPDPDLAVWTLWAVKESAYKAHVRMGGEKGFYPGRIICDPETGTVSIRSKTYFFKFEHVPGKLSACAASDKHLLSELVMIDPEFLCKRDGLPFVREAGTWKPASMSHHGRFTEAVTIAG